MIALVLKIAIVDFETASGWGPKAPHIKITPRFPRFFNLNFQLHFSLLITVDIDTIAKMPGISLADTINHLSVDEEWGPETTSTTTLDGVPYAPYSKGDKLGRMADWTTEGKEGRDGRGGRQYGRNYRGITFPPFCEWDRLTIKQINLCTAQALRHSSLSRSLKMNHPSQ